MTNFLIPAVVLLILVLAILLRTLVFPGKALAISRRQMNAEIYREELDKLALERAAGSIDAATYDLTHEEIRQRLFQDTLEEDDQAVLISPKKTIIGLVLFILVISSGLYFMLGDATRAVQQESEKPMTPEAVQKMVSEFAAKMEKDPTNLEGWAMLGRSYQVLGRNAEAQTAYERAGTFIDTDPQLMADYANVLVINSNGNFAGKPQQLINKALKKDPANPLALWLSGVSAFNSGNYQAALKSWETLQKQLAPESDEARAVAESIAEARSMGKLPAAPTKATPPLGSSNSKGVSGIVELSPAFKSKVKPTDILMVIARQPGVRMPVAVLKTSVAEFPMKFVLDDSLAMNPNAPISQLTEVSVEVRISKTGMATPEAGDLISAPQTIKVGTSNLRLAVDQVRP
jgi:cytochrome c-type biogenesis protein CcmH